MSGPLLASNGVNYKEVATMLYTIIVIIVILIILGFIFGRGRFM